MNTTISSLALIRAYFDDLEKDYLDCFIPFVATYLTRYWDDRVDSTYLVDGLKKEFGLTIPYLAMEAIIDKCIGVRLIRRESQYLYVDRRQANKRAFSEEALKLDRGFGTIIQEIRSYAQENYNVKLKEKEAEKLFIDFLDEYNLDVLVFANKDDPLCATHIDKDVIIVKDFIQSIAITKPAILNSIVDIAFGHTIVSMLCYEGVVPETQCKDIKVFLDTRIVLRALGGEGKPRKDAYKEFIKLAQEAGAKMLIYRHTYNEIINILHACRPHLNSGNFDPGKAGPSARYFYDEGWSLSKLDHFIASIRKNLDRLGIFIEEFDLSPRDREFYPDPKRLYTSIRNAYGANNPDFAEEEQRTQIERDVDSICYTIAQRKGEIYHSLSECPVVFVTLNGTIARCCQRYEQTEASNQLLFPSCVTDKLITTLLWLQKPTKLIEFNRRRLIADCKAALAPSSKLLKTFLSHAEDLKEQGKISSHDFFALRTDRTMMNMLVRKTKGNVENITMPTTEELLNEYKSELIRPERENRVKAEEEKEKYRQQMDAEKTRRQAAEQNAENVVKHIQNRCDKIAARIVRLLIVVGGVAAFVVTFNIKPDWMPRWTWTVAGMVVVAFSILGQFGVGYDLLKRTFSKWIYQAFSSIPYTNEQALSQDNDQR